MAEPGENLRFTLAPRQAAWIRRERIRPHLQRDITVELGVSGTVDLAPAALADLGGDFVRAEAGAGAEGHGGWG